MTYGHDEPPKTLGEKLACNLAHKAAVEELQRQGFNVATESNGEDTKA